MLKFFKTDGGVLSELNHFEDGIWADLADPTMDEIKLIANKYKIDTNDIIAILDDEETSRVEQE